MSTRASFRSMDITILNPAYWGSLTALCVGILLLAVQVAKDGAPAHALGVLGSYKEGLFGMTLFLVAIICLRYYLAVSVNIYGGSPHSILRLPKGGLRIVAFAVNCMLILLCNLSVGALVGFGVAVALALCGGLGGLAAVLAGMWYVAAQFDRRFKPASAGIFGVVDVALALFMAWLVNNIIGGVERETAVGLVVGSIVFAGAFYYEFKKRYKEDLWEQVCEAAGRLK